MDGDKEIPMEISEGSIQMAEKESNGDHLPQSSGTVKDNTEVDDGADEKLVGEDGALKTNKEASEVKFISGDAQNGDAKIDIENMKIAFVGMGKEELMKFANDPFWVRLRWFLFILFWLLWAAMLGGAIAIIVLAPKCAPPAPLKWWEQSPVYKIFLPAFKDGSEPQNGIGDLKGLQSKLAYIESLGVKGVVLSTLLKGSSGSNEEAIEDFKDIDKEYGTLAEFKEFLASLKKKGIHLILNLVPNHSSKNHEWFVKSEGNDPLYSDYYIWSSGSLNTSGNKVPPNNWLIVNGEDSAWQWSDKRSAYYLHQFHPDQPDLNFRNPAVVEEFKAIFKFWWEAGVSGFQLEKVEYLLEDVALENEVPSGKPGTTHNQYDFYRHFKTTQQDGIIEILTDWKQAIKNFSDSEGVLSIAGKLSLDLFYGHENKSHVDLLQSDGVFSNLKKDFTARDLNNTIHNYEKRRPNKTRSAWQLSSSTSRVPSHYSDDDVDGLNMVVMLLPGTPITLYGDELGMEDADSGQSVMSWSNDTNAGFTTATPKYRTSRNFEVANVDSETKTAGSSLAVYKDLVAARNTPSIMYGETEYAELGNSTVFAITRVKSGNPGYLAAFNTADYDVTVDFTKLKSVPSELNVQILSSNFNDPKVKVKSKLNAQSLHLNAKAAFVATFVPKADE